MPRRFKRTRICGRVLSSSLVKDRSTHKFQLFELAKDLDDFIKEFFYGEISFSYDSSNLNGQVYLCGESVAYLIRTVLQYCTSDQVFIKFYCEDGYCKLLFTFPEGFEEGFDRLKCSGLAANADMNMRYCDGNLIFSKKYLQSNILTVYEKRCRIFYDKLMNIFFG